MNEAINIDIMDWQEFPKYDILWTDPPWGERMVKFFQKLAAQHGKDVNHTLPDLVNHLASKATNQKPLFVEMNMKGYEEVNKIITAKGHKLNNITHAQYKDKRPYVILAYNTNILIPDGLEDGQNIAYAIEHLKPQTVFDPFAGIGVTARHVISAGASYIGSEVNPNRYAKLVRAVQ